MSDFVKIKIAIILVLYGSLAGAEYIPMNGKHLYCSDIKYLSKDLGHYVEPDAYSKRYDDIAKESFIYSLMASNVYEEYDGGKPEFFVRGWEKEREKVTTWKGLGAHIYRSKFEPNNFVIAFEGTNSTSLLDWIFGNLNLGWKGQYADAAALVQKIKTTYPSSKIVTTGHSLGGGLAIHAALYHGNIDAYAFNSSPRVFKEDVKDTNSRIVLISEDEDILQSLRKFLGTLDSVTTTKPFDEFDFLKSSKLNEHSIYHISRGLMLVAASADNNDSHPEINLDDEDDNARRIIKNHIPNESIKCSSRD